MHALYGLKKGTRNVAATFDSEQQLLAYVRWATLSKQPDGTCKFEQKTPLVGCSGCEHETIDPAEAAQLDVPHNPTPGML